VDSPKYIPGEFSSRFSHEMLKESGSIRRSSSHQIKKFTNDPEKWEGNSNQVSKELEETKVKLAELQKTLERRDLEIEKLNSDLNVA